ncbi:MAG: glycosyltransferase family 2 protein [Sphingomonadales bacterium]|jgi:glycosyltransferase involved in cell wall biosynthesis
MKISIISPVYKAEKILPELVRRIDLVCKENHLDAEIILVDDRSPDQSWSVLSALVKEYPILRAYRLSKNFGQHYAITAGISVSSGDVMILMDCDLQDRPENIPLLLEKYREGYDVVCTLKSQKKYSLYRKLSSDLFFLAVNTLSDVKLEKNLGTMTLINRKVADAFMDIRDYHRHSSMIIAWLGFNRGHVQVVQDDRFEGKSSYNFRSLIRHAINGVVSQSDKLLRLSIAFGMCSFIASLLGVMYIIVKSFFVQFEMGWPSIVVLILFTTGIILLMLGIAGLYIGKIFDQVKNRPLFIIAEQTEQPQ